MTLVSHRHEFIFLKTHKTGSTSVEAALEPLCLPPGAPVGPHRRPMEISEDGIVGARGGAHADAKWTAHMSARRVRRLVGRPRWRRYLKVAVVRNPYDRMVSMFWWRLQDSERAKLADAPFGEVRARFEAWLASAEIGKNIGKLCIGPAYALDHVVYYEHLDEGLAALSDRLGAEIAPLPRYKSGARLRAEHWRDYFDVQTVRIVEARAGFELAFFGYDLSGGPRLGTRAKRARRLLAHAPGKITNAFRTPRPAPPLTGACAPHRKPSARA